MHKHSRPVIYHYPFSVNEGGGKQEMRDESQGNWGKKGLERKYALYLAALTNQNF